jgi:hypothetical protein
MEIIVEEGKREEKMKRYAFIRYFTSGHLQGIHYPDSIAFPNKRMFLNWMKRVNRNNRDSIILEDPY